MWNRRFRPAAAMIHQRPAMRFRWSTTSALKRERVSTRSVECVPWQGALLSLVETQAGELSLQPEALGTDQEATNGLKHSEKRPLRQRGAWIGRLVLRSWVA
jgi:hypothetical protein